MPDEPEEPGDDDEIPEDEMECDSCHFKTNNLISHERERWEMRPGDSPICHFCELCYGTPASNWFKDGRLASDESRKLMQAIMYTGNTILCEIRRLEKLAKGD